VELLDALQNDCQLAAGESRVARRVGFFVVEEPQVHHGPQTVQDRPGGVTGGFHAAMQPGVFGSVQQRLGKLQL